MKFLVTTSFIYFLILFSGTSTYAQDWANLERYKDANIELMQSRSQNNRVVFMGNSITEGWATTCPRFFSKSPYVNRGIGGQTTPQMLVRFRADVIDLQPEVVIILAGTNDLAGNTGLSTLKMISDNIFSMAELAAAHDIKVIISSILPVYDYPWNPGLNPSEKIIQLNETLKNYCDKMSHIYLDYHSKMVDERNGMKAAYSGDGVHPNKAGYEVMEALVEEAINKTIHKE